MTDTQIGCGEASGSISNMEKFDFDVFFSMSDHELLRLVHSEFPHELDRLKRAYSLSSRNTVLPSTPSPSQILFEAQHDEVNRTLISLLALRWIYLGQYETFTRTQSDSVKLERASFDWMHEIFKRKLNTKMDLYTLVLSHMVNDLGKDPQLAHDYQSKTGEDISAVNHDMILFKSAEIGLIDSLDRLPSQRKGAVMRSIRLGTVLNLGQLAQAENAPACLASFRDMTGHEDEFEFHFMKQLLDISGASGHEDWTCAKKMIQPICKAYQDVHEVALCTISGDYGFREAYDVVLIRRSAMLSKLGSRLLDVQELEHRALLRLLCMGGVASREKADLYFSAWAALNSDTKDSLVQSLNVDGTISQPAIQPTYMPAMLGQATEGGSSMSRNDLVQRLVSVLMYLSRVMTLTGANHGEAEVFERSVLWVLKDVVQSPAFDRDPSILERTTIPQTTVAKLA